MNLGERRPNKWWTETDTFAMLTLIEQLDLVHELDKKRQRNDSHFRRLRQSLAKRHIHFTVNQIRNRWKSLKHKYRKIKTACYRSPAARLSAMESFRYFRMLDRMLANRMAQEEGPVVGHDSLVLTPSDVEDHTDSTDDVPQPGSAASWHDPLGPNPEGASREVKPDPDDTSDLDQRDWAVNGTNEVMTLGLSGEYLGSVKADPIPSSTLQNLEGAREPASCSSEEFQGVCEDSSSLILQQLTILNHQLSEQLAEQRAFHCSMLGMMDRQIEVLEQLSSFTRAQQGEQAASRLSPSDSGTSSANVTRVATAENLVTNATTTAAAAAAAAVAALDTMQLGKSGCAVARQQQDVERQGLTPETPGSCLSTLCTSEGLSGAVVGPVSPSVTVCPKEVPLASPMPTHTTNTDSESSCGAGKGELKEEEEKEMAIDASPDGISKGSQHDGRCPCRRDSIQENGLVDEHQQQ